MSNAGISLRVIQEISGHRNLEQFERYLEVSDDSLVDVVREQCNGESECVSSANLENVLYKQIILTSEIDELRVKIKYS